MPNWKKVIVSGSDAELNSLNVTSALTASGLIYPASDGTGGQVIVTDGAGNLSFDIPDAEKITFAVQNDFTSTLQKGTPIHVTSTTNGTALVIPASASDASTMPAHGILNGQLAVGVDGEATIIGQITGVDTSAFSSGDTVYVGASGGYTNVKPQGSGNLIQNLGVVKKVDALNGTGEIFGAGRTNDVPNLPTGKIWVGSSTYSVTSSVVHLDETNERIGINTNTPGASLDVIGDISGSTKITVGYGLTNSGTNTAVFGINNTTLGNYSLIAGGDNCITSFSNSSIAGGGLNVIAACCSFIGSGLANGITGGYSTISSGVFNQITAECSFIGAGSSNTGSDQRTFIGAGQCNKAGGGYTAIVGGFKNEVINYGTQTTGCAEQSFIGSGISNCIAGGGYGTIVGGFDNFVSASNAGFIGAGITNTIAGGYASNQFSEGHTIAGGKCNKICYPAHYNSFIGGGFCNIVSCDYGTIGGGRSNCVTGGYASIIGGGCLNTVSAAFSGILGGTNNTVSHECSFAIGRNLTSDKADYTFVNNIQAQTNISGSTLSLTGLTNQAAEATAVMIDSSNVVGTRELGSNAFNSTAFVEDNGGATNEIAFWSSATAISGSGNLTFNGTVLRVTSSVEANSFTGSFKIPDDGTLGIGEQTFYPQGNDGFSVNEDFNVGNANQTAYHFTSGDVNRTSVVFSLARTTQFTNMFGVTGSNTDNSFVIGSEFANTDFEWRSGLGVTPVSLKGGTLLGKLDRSGSLYVSSAITGSTLQLTNLPSQASEATSLMIGASGNVGTRELGSNAFNSTAFTTCTGTVTSVGGTGTVSGITLSGTVTTSGNLTLGGTFSTTTSSITNFNSGVGTIIDSCGFTTCTGTVTGTGTQNYVTKWSSGGAGIEDSLIYDNGSNVSIGVQSTTGSLYISGSQHNSSFNDGILIIEQKTGDKLFIDGNDIDTSGSGKSLYLQDYSGNDTIIGGNVGIGNSAPGEKLVVAGNISGSGCLTIGSSHTNTGTLSSIAGGTLNTASGACSFIGGGQENTTRNCFDTILGGRGVDISTNTVSCGYNIAFSDTASISSCYGYNTVIGGKNNTISNSNSGCHTMIGSTNGTISAYYSTRHAIIGGYNNSISGYFAGQSTILGGFSNTITSTPQSSVILGGGNNSMQGAYSSIVAGRYNSNSGYYSGLGGGCRNVLTSNCSFLGGGSKNCLTGYHSSIVGGTLNTGSGACGFIGGGLSNTICSTETFAVIGGGRQNRVDGDYSSVVGGYLNCVAANLTSIVGGTLNTGSGACSFIGGGASNNITLACGCRAFIGGGNSNTICDTSAPGSTFNDDAIVGGSNNSITGCYSGGSLIAGGTSNCINNTFGGTNIIGGGSNNSINSSFSGVNLIVGGGTNCISIGTGGYSSIVGGYKNYVTNGYSFIGGGTLNTGSGACSFIGGGCLNNICSGETFAVIGGGRQNRVDGDYTSVVGGYLNCTDGNCSFIGGGYSNYIVTGQNNAIVGGYDNYINGNNTGCIGNFIGAGRANCIQYAGCATIVGGYLNCILSTQCGFIGGGYGNCMSSYALSFIGGGYDNAVLNSCCSTIVAGASNIISSACYSFIGGGGANCICNSSGCSFIGGGYSNLITTNACCSGILAGYNNTISGYCNSFIIGCSLSATANAYTFMNNACVAGETRTQTLVETSARKYKECILPLQDQIENIKKLEPVEFQWKKDKTKDIGFIAEDVLKVYPDLVAYEENGEINGIQYSKLTTVLVKALQQQQEQIDSLKLEIENLKQK